MKNHYIKLKVAEQNSDQLTLMKLKCDPHSRSKLNFI